MLKDGERAPKDVERPCRATFLCVLGESDYVSDKSYNNSYGHVRMNLCILQTESARLADVLDGHDGSRGILLGFLV